MVPQGVATTCQFDIKGTKVDRRGKRNWGVYKAYAAGRNGDGLNGLMELFRLNSFFNLRGYPPCAQFGTGNGYCHGLS